MAKLIALNVNVSKIDKTRLYKGQKGYHLDLIVSLNDEDDKYGNRASCWQGQTKEEREAKIDRNFLGNGKVIWEDDPVSTGPEERGAYGAGNTISDDDVPF